MCRVESETNKYYSEMEKEIHVPLEDIREELSKIVMGYIEEDGLTDTVYTCCGAFWQEGFLNVHAIIKGEKHPMTILEYLTECAMETHVRDIAEERARDKLAGEM